MLNLTLLIAVLIGAAFAAQPVINAAAGQVLGSVLAATVLSVGITLVASALVLLASGHALSLSALAQLPWWVPLGGVIGVLVVGGSAIIVPITGVALFFVCLIAGQLIGSVFLDHIGAFGIKVQEVTPQRLLGLGLAIAGVVLVRFG